MSLRDTIAGRVEMYQFDHVARIWKGHRNEPAYYGRLMDDPHGAGTRFTFDVLTVHRREICVEYPIAKIQIPFLMARAHTNGQRVFFLVIRDPDLFLVPYRTPNVKEDGGRIILVGFTVKVLPPYDFLPLALGRKLGNIPSVTG